MIENDKQAFFLLKENYLKCVTNCRISEREGKVHNMSPICFFCCQIEAVKSLQYCCNNEYSIGIPFSINRFYQENFMIISFSIVIHKI